MASTPFGDPDAVVPAGLATAEFVLRPIVADDAPRDYAAVVETREQLRLWEQSSWPADDFTVEDNRADLVDLEQRHADRRAFTYTVVDPDDTECLGCVYVFPTTATFLTKASVTPVADAVWSDADAVVYFWVRASRIDTGLDARLLAALREWFGRDWGFERTVFVTSEQFAQQVALIRGTDLALQFELREPGKPGTFLVFG